MTWHDADLALSRSDHTWAVRADQANAQLVTLNFGIQHVQGRNAFGDTYDQLDASVSGFQDRILTERCWNVDNRGFCTRRFNRFSNRVEYRQAQVSLTTLAWSNTTDHLGAVCNCLFRVKGTLSTRKTLTNNFSIFVD